MSAPGCDILQALQRAAGLDPALACEVVQTLAVAPEKNADLVSWLLGLLEAPVDDQHKERLALAELSRPRRAAGHRPPERRVPSLEIGLTGRLAPEVVSGHRKPRSFRQKAPVAQWTEQRFPNRKNALFANFADVVVPAENPGSRSEDQGTRQQSMTLDVTLVWAAARAASGRNRCTSIG